MSLRHSPNIYFSAVYYNFFWDYVSGKGRGVKIEAGVSRVVLAVVLMVMSVSLAIVVYSAARGTIFNVAKGSEALAPKTNLEIVSFNPNSPYDGWAEIGIRNRGPNDIPSGDPSSWTVFINDTAYAVREILDPNGDDTLSVDEVLTIRVEVGTINSNSVQTIRVYGPGGSKAYAGWSPSG